MYFRCTASTVPTCHTPLIEIDHYGERLTGCIECNRWGRLGDATLPMQLREDDFEALRDEAGALSRVMFLQGDVPSRFRPSLAGAYFGSSLIALL